MANNPSSRKKEKHASFATLSASDQRKALAGFVEGLLLHVFPKKRDSWEKWKGKGKKNRADRPSVAPVKKDFAHAALTGASNELGASFSSKFSGFTTQAFHDFVEAACDQGLLRIVPPIDGALSFDVHRRFEGLREVVVTSGSSRDRFSETAAREFLAEIRRISQLKRKGESLCIGLVSGTTVQSVLERLCHLDWEDLGVKDLNRLDKVRIFPLNGSLTEPEFLSGNATVLVHALAQEINARFPGMAAGYGLNAPLVLRKDQQAEVDAVKQTQDVLKYTAPRRCVGSSDGQPLPVGTDDTLPTKLDIVLTGVGQAPRNDEAKGSIFFRLAEDNAFAVRDLLNEQHVVGDLAFIPISSHGGEALLKKGDSQYMFYSAIDLSILAAMARNRDKCSVILVAQSSAAHYKVPVIFASIGGAIPENCYASTLIVDEPTANDLLTYRGSVV